MVVPDLLRWFSLLKEENDSFYACALEGSTRAVKNCVEIMVFQKFFANCPYDSGEIEVVYGFDGSRPEEQKPEEVHLFNNAFHKSLLPGERGCFISHLRIFQEIVDTNAEWAMIFEDDALFSQNYLEKMSQVLAELPMDSADILYIGGRFRENFIMQEQGSKKFSDNIVLHNMKPRRMPWEHDRTTHAYMISARCAKVFLSNFPTLINIPDMPIDKWMILSLEHNQTNIYNTYPLLCHCPGVSDSDIR